MRGTEIERAARKRPKISTPTICFCGPVRKRTSTPSGQSRGGLGHPVEGGIYYFGLRERTPGCRDRNRPAVPGQYNEAIEWTDRSLSELPRYGPAIRTGEIEHALSPQGPSRTPMRH